MPWHPDSHMFSRKNGSGTNDFDDFFDDDFDDDDDDDGRDSRCLMHSSASNLYSSAIPFTISTTHLSIKRISI
jgi:hypothetical protein